MKEKKQALGFQEILDEITSLTGASKEEVKSRLAQFYDTWKNRGSHMSTVEIYKPKHHVRFVTASSLFDGHDASIKLRRISLVP